MDASRETFPLLEGCDEGYVVTNGVRLHYVAAGSGPLGSAPDGQKTFSTLGRVVMVGTSRPAGVIHSHGAFSTLGRVVMVGT